MFNVLDVQLQHICPFLPIARRGHALHSGYNEAHFSATLLNLSVTLFIQVNTRTKYAQLRSFANKRNLYTHLPSDPKQLTASTSMCNQRLSCHILNPVTNRMESLFKATEANTLPKLLHNLCPLYNFARPLLLCLASPTQHPLCVAALLFVWNWLSWQIVSDDKIQIRKLILRRGALSTSAGLYHPIDILLTAIPKTWTNAVHYKFRRRRSSWKVLSFTWLLLCSQIVRTKGEKARNLDSTSLKGQVLTTRFITKIISALFPSNLNDIPHLFATIIIALLQNKVSELNSYATVTTDAGSPLLIVDWEQPLFYEGSDKTYESQYNQLQR